MCGRRFVGTHHHHNLRVTQPYPQTLKGIEHTCGEYLWNTPIYVCKINLLNMNPGHEKGLNAFLRGKIEWKSGQPRPTTSNATHSSNGFSIVLLLLISSTARCHGKIKLTFSSQKILNEVCTMTFLTLIFSEILLHHHSQFCFHLYCSKKSYYSSPTISKIGVA